MQDFIEDELDENLDDLEPIVDNPAELYEHFRVVVDKGQKQVRIDKYLFERLVNSSRNRIQKAADAGFVMANGKPVKNKKDLHNPDNHDGVITDLEPDILECEVKWALESITIESINCFG